MSQQSEQLGRLRWKCRRGMLELDLVLLPFLDTCYELLSAHQKQVFERLLEEQDPVLQSWFMHHTIPEDKELADMVEYMRAAVKGVYACNSSKKA